jgi:hypothetical protein
VHPRDLYGHFASVSGFAQGIDWTQGFRELEKVGVEFGPGAAHRRYGVVEFTSDIESWDPADFNRPLTFRIDEAGLLDRPELLSRTLHGTVNHPDLHNPQTFLLHCPGAGEFQVEIEGVSGWGGANLRVFVDGEERLTLDFQDRSNNTDTIHSYDERHSVALEPGSHEITVVNDGTDWVTVSYAVANEWMVPTPSVRCVGLRGPNDVLVWVQNRDFDLHTVRELSVQPSPVKDAWLAVRLPGPASYRVQVWDTWAGEERSRGRVRGSSDARLRLPSFREALALRISRTP